jgi:hypothetical protein
MISIGRIWGKSKPPGPDAGLCAGVSISHKHNGVLA